MHVERVGTATWRHTQRLLLADTLNAYLQSNKRQLVGKTAATFLFLIYIVKSSYSFKTNILIQYRYGWLAYACAAPLTDAKGFKDSSCALVRILLDDMAWIKFWFALPLVAASIHF